MAEAHYHTEMQTRIKAMRQYHPQAHVRWMAGSALLGSTRAWLACEQLAAQDIAENITRELGTFNNRPAEERKPHEHRTDQSAANRAGHRGVRRSASS